MLLVKAQGEGTETRLRSDWRSACKRQGMPSGLTVAALTIFTLCLGCALWWLWRTRQEAERVALRGQRFAEVGSRSAETARVVALLLDVADADLQLDSLSRGGSPSTNDRLGSTLRSARDAVRALSIEEQGASTELVVRSALGLVPRIRSALVVRFGGEFPLQGSIADAVHLVRGLLGYAVDRAEEVQGVVGVVLTHERLTIEHPSMLELPARSGDRNPMVVLGRLARSLGWSIKRSAGEIGHARFVIEPLAPRKHSTVA